MLMGGGKMSIRKFYHEYKSELGFGFVLCMAVAVSYLISPYIPEDWFRSIISPLQNSANCAVTVIFAWLFARHNEGIRVRKLCAWLAGALAIIFIGSFIARIKAEGVNPVAEGAFSFERWELMFGAIIAWILLAYPYELLRPGCVTLRSSMMRILPVILIGAIDYYVPWDLRWMLAAVPIIWVGLIFFHLRSYRKYCEENYSSLEDTDERWVIRYLMMMFVIGISYFHLYFSTEPNRLFTQQWLMFFVLAYAGEKILFRSNAWMERKEKEDMEDQYFANGSLQPDGEYKAALEQWMEKEKPYLNPKFCLLDMRDVLPLNRTYLSQLIKNTYGCNFYQFVTNYRIEEAKRLLRENPYMKMQDVAEQSGFSSPTVFTRIFAKETGFLPSEWLEANSQ